MNLDLSADLSSYFKCLDQHKDIGLQKPDLGCGLDVIGADSFKDYLYWLTKVGSLPAYCIRDIREGVPAKDCMYWMVSDIRRITNRLPRLIEFAEQRSTEASSFLRDWTYWLSKSDSYGVFCEYNAFMSMWGESRSYSKAYPGRFFLEVVFGYVYARHGQGVAEISPRSVAYNS
jgi:hypothetical protein